MKYIVIGGAGFIGSHLVDKLIELQHDVLVIDNLSTGQLYNINKNARVVYGDLIDTEYISRFFDDTVNGVFHLTTSISIKKSPLIVYEESYTVLEYCRQKNIPRIVLTSSAIVYNKNKNTFNEKTIDFLVQLYKDTHNMSVICLRNSNVYGTRQNTNKNSSSIFTLFKKCKMLNGFIEITGDDNQCYDFIHVSDIVNGYIQAMNSTYCGIIDLCTGIYTTLNEISTYFECPVHYSTKENNDITYIYQDTVLAKKYLNWEPTILLHTGILDLFEESKNKITIITSIYNEELLLPLWIEHYKKLQQNNIIHNILVIDRNSTDNSIHIIKKTCPNWIIVHTKITCFETEMINKEIMDYEKNIPGYKLVLNITEFLICDDISSIIHTEQPLCYEINVKVVLSHKKYHFPQDVNDLLNNMKCEIRNNYTLSRYLHSYSTGNYELYRYKTSNTITQHNIPLFCIYWIGIYSLSDIFLNRLLKIKDEIPEINELKKHVFQFFETIDVT